MTYSDEEVFLALMLWREARGENIDGKIAVAHCVLNRVSSPKWWGKTIMDVIFKKFQFSSLTDPKDKQLTTWPASADAAWQTCLAVAGGSVSGLYKNPVPGADSYHDTSIMPPKWATPENFVKKIGKLMFYNTDGDLGKG